jgi:hypothetical protein
MAFEFVRGYVQLASGLGELTKARAMEAAQGLLTLPGADEVGKRAMQVSALADQLLDAARANRESLIAMVRSEVESALRRSDVVHLADLELARTAVAALTREVDDLRRSVLAEASRSPLGKALPGAAAAISTIPRPSAHPSPAATVSVAAVPERRTTGERPAAKKATAKKATAKKATAKKATAKKATAKKATAKKSTTKKTAAKKAATKKAAPGVTASEATAPETATASTPTPTSVPTSTRTEAATEASTEAATENATENAVAGDNLTGNDNVPENDNVTGTTTDE